MLAWGSLVKFWAIHSIFSALERFENPSTGLSMGYGLKPSKIKNPTLIGLGGSGACVLGKMKGCSVRFVVHNPFWTALVPVANPTTKFSIPINISKLGGFNKFGTL